MDAASSGDADLAAVGALVADPGRCRILLALDDGRALPASMLAAEAGVTPATASSHLRKLTAAGLLAVETHGRYRYYRLAGPTVARLIETLGALPRPRRSAPCARTPEPRHCAAPAPATTTSQDGSVWHSWPPSSIAAG